VEPKEHWEVILISLGLGLTLFIGVLFGDTSIWVPVVVAVGAYVVGWATHLLRRQRTPKR